MNEHLKPNTIFSPTPERPISLYDRIGSSAEALIGAPSVPYDKLDRSFDPEEGVDCSGFVTYVLKKEGIFVPETIRHSNEYFDSFGITIHRPRRGDLVFFSFDKGLTPTHIGIMTSDTEYVHAPGKKDTFVKKDQLEWKFIHQVGENAIYFTNPIGFKRLMRKEGRYHVSYDDHPVFPD